MGSSSHGPVATEPEKQPRAALMIKNKTELRTTDQSVTQVSRPFFWESVRESPQTHLSSSAI